jgi:lipopolysaccharide transport system permease protein
MLIYYKVHITPITFLLLPSLLLLILVFSLGLGLFLSPINAKYRDIRIALPFFIQLGFFVTPVIYPTSLFGGSLKLIRIFNPVAEAIEVSRSTLFGTRHTDWKILAMSVIFALIVFFIGYAFFKTKEEKFVDIL